jgi:hypothetical protein
MIRHVLKDVGSFRLRWYPLWPWHLKGEIRDLIANLIVDTARSKPVPNKMIRGRHADARF